MTANYAELLHTSRVWILEHLEREVIGVPVTQAEVDHLLIDSIAVSPTAHGRGHRRILLERADQDARELACRRSGCAPTRR